MPRIITLTSDFGLTDPYVAAMKGAILAVEPSVRLVDVSHLVEPHRVAEAAYLLQSVVSIFPADTIHLAVVDPGVGTARKALAFRGERGIFVGPDNGLFAPVLADQSCIDRSDGRVCAGIAVEVTNERYRRPSVSTTFHGRDIFAPAAAHLAAGVDLRELGPELDRIQALEQPRVDASGAELHGAIVHIDRFGNAISNLRAADVPASPIFRCGGRSIEGLSTTYQDGELIALTGSTGLIEIAVRNASAARSLGIKLGDEITVRVRP